MARKLLKRDRDTLAHFIADEFTRRKKRREVQGYDAAWAEIDRQIEMKPQELRDADKNPENLWRAAIEMPQQANSSEILGKDTKRLLFPPGENWFEAHAVFTDELAESAQGKPLFQMDEGDLKMQAVIQGIDPLKAMNEAAGEFRQEEANMVVKAVMDGNHKLYRYRLQWEKLVLDANRKGTLVGRIAELQYSARRFKGNGKYPALVHVPLQNMYLDDAAQNLALEGLELRPIQMRFYHQQRQDIMAAAKNDDTWIAEAVKLLPERTGQHESSKRDHFELVEAEGDFIIERSDGSFTLENQVVTICLNQGPYVLRMRDGLGFSSYLIDTYQTEAIDSPYGAGPLMKGRPLQAALTASVNEALNISALQAAPPIGWNRNDPDLAATGGPLVHPHAKWKTRNPDSIKTYQIGDLASTIALIQYMQSTYESVVNVQDARRGVGAKSHTTATSGEIELSRGLLPTEEFAQSVQRNSMTDWLYIEWELLRKNYKKQRVFVDHKGTKQHLTIQSGHLAKEADFVVHGARGPFEKRERRENVVFVTNLFTQLVGAGLLQDERIRNMAMAVAEEFEIAEPERFIESREGSGAPPQQGAPVEGPAQGPPGI